MNTCNVKNRWSASAQTGSTMNGGRAIALLVAGLTLLPLPAGSGERPADTPREAWPITVHARYHLRYNSIEVGHIDISSTTTAKTYSVTGSGKVSVLFGTFKWWGSSRVSGTIENGVPVPATYAFEWHHNKKKKDVAIHIGYENHTASEVSVTPPPRVRPDTVPLMQVHKSGAFDPLSATMMLTKADSRPPCNRRVGVFDGTQRYDIVFTPKRQMRLPSLSGGAPEIAHVCRITYEPVAGHRDNADTKAYASNHDVEVVLRHIPGTEMFIPYSVTIPTAWGNGTMVTERAEVVTASGKLAFTD